MTAATAHPAAEPPVDERVLADIVARLEARRDAIADAAAEAIFAEIPAYQAHATPALRRGVRQHVGEHIAATLATFRRREPVGREELLFIRRHAGQRAGQLSVAEFIQAFQVGQRILWDAILELAGDDVSRSAVLSLVGHITRYFEVVVTHAAEVYLEAEQLLAATGERLRRDTLEDLLAGTPIAPGPRLRTLREAGLDPPGDCLVICAAPVAPIEDAHALRGAAAALGRVSRQPTAPLTVIRHDEIVIVTPARRDHLPALVERLAATQRRLAEHVVALAVGTSTLHDGVDDVPAAYAEALDARSLLGGRPGVAALPAMSSFDYLVRRGSATARRLVPPVVQRFLEDDATHGGTLVTTLRAYAAADLNVRRAAQQLHVHVNTVHYRLTKIEERAGVDLRHVGDVLELLIAAELAQHARATAAARAG